jgi:hypothetical protein
VPSLALVLYLFYVADKIDRYAGKSANFIIADRKGLQKAAVPSPAILHYNRDTWVFFGDMVVKPVRNRSTRGYLPVKAQNKRRLNQKKLLHNFVNDIMMFCASQTGKPPRLRGR